MAMRFVAGAVCPECGATDTLKMDTEAAEEAPYRECVDCGFSEQGGSEADPSAADPTTRFSNSEGAAADPDQPQVLRILPGTGKTLH